MPVTPELQLPYPILSDTADVPRDIKALAEALDALKMTIVSQPGDLKPTARSNAPVDGSWLLCNGVAVPRGGDTAALFDAIGLTYGAGDGLTTFNLPNLQGRVPVGRSPGEPEFAALNSPGGAKAVALDSVNYLPSHAHGVTVGAVAGDNPTLAHGHNFGLGPTGVARTVPTANGWNLQIAGIGVGTVHAEPTDSSATYETINATGGTGDLNHGHAYTENAVGAATPHANLQPYIVVNWLIKV